MASRAAAVILHGFLDRSLDSGVFSQAISWHVRETICDEIDGRRRHDPPMTILTRIAIYTTFVLLNGAAIAASEDACWAQWSSQEIGRQPKPEDTINQQTGKPLSQTDAAKRSRAKKLQAFNDAMVLRGRGSDGWKAFRERCISTTNR